MREYPATVLDVPPDGTLYIDIDLGLNVRTVRCLPLTGVELPPEGERLDQAVSFIKRWLMATPAPSWRHDEASMVTVRTVRDRGVEYSVEVFRHDYRADRPDPVSLNQALVEAGLAAVRVRRLRPVHR